MTTATYARNRLAVLALPLVLILSGCIHVFPLKQIGEKKEAMALARILRRLAPEAKTLLQHEHELADELKITMEEAGDKVGGDSGKVKFGSFIDRLIVIRDGRRHIQDTVRQSAWESPMVYVVQRDAIAMLQDEINRTETWIEFAQNLRLRASLGRDKNFPELAILNAQLDAFLAATAEAPLYDQLHALQEEYRFGEGEIAEAE